MKHLFKRILFIISFIASILIPNIIFWFSLQLLATQKFLLGMGVGLLGIISYGGMIYVILTLDDILTNRKGDMNETNNISDSDISRK